MQAVAGGSGCPDVTLVDYQTGTEVLLSSFTQNGARGHTDPPLQGYKLSVAVLGGGGLAVVFAGLQASLP